MFEVIDPAAPVEIIRVTGPGHDDATREFLAGDETATDNVFRVDAIMAAWVDVVDGRAESSEVRIRDRGGQCIDYLIHWDSTPIGRQVVIRQGGE